MKDEWAPDRVLTLRKLWAEGLSSARIGRMMDISKNAVLGKAHRLKLEPRPSPIHRDGEPRPPRPVRVPIPALLPLMSTKPEVMAEVPSLPPPIAVAAVKGHSRPCCWPMWSNSVRPRWQDQRFCEAPGIPGKAYCEDHGARAWAAVAA